MTRAKTRKIFGSRKVTAAGAPFDLGGVPPAGKPRPHASSRRGGGRLGRALRAAGKEPPAPTRKRQSAAEALERWEGEGGRKASPAMPARAKAPEAAKATKKSVTKSKRKPVKPARKP